MSSLNPVVGVSLCIGALGAGLAYLAWSNNDDDNTSDDHVEKLDKSTNMVEETTEASENKVVEETTEEKKVAKSEETTETEKDIKVEKNNNDSNKKEPNMKEFLKQTYNEGME